MLETIGKGLQGTDRVSAVLSKQWSVKNQWSSAREWLSRGLTVLSSDAMRGNCDNCSYTHTQAICTRVLTAPVRLEHSQ